jgi:DNA polymerase-3 subunit epsilon
VLFRSLSEAISKLTARPSLPSHLDPDLPDQIPESHGVYIFYGDQRFPLYVGKSNNLRKRVMSHFAADHARGKEMSLSMQVKEIEWIETPGEIAALLKESSLVKSLLPSHNTRLRRNQELCSWRIHHPPDSAGDGGVDKPLTPELVWARDLNFGAQPNLFGLFRSQREAHQMLSDLAQSEKLCKAILGLEKVSKGSSCFGFQLKQCKGACIGKEPPELHRARLSMALAKHRIPVWPYAGPVGLREADAIHLVDHWCYLGTARSDDDLQEILADGQPVFDLDAFKILQKAMRTLTPIIIPKTHEPS